MNIAPHMMSTRFTATSPIVAMPAAGSETPICLLTVPVLSELRSRPGHAPGTPPVIEVLASVRRRSTEWELDGPSTDTLTAMTLAEATLAPALSDACRATHAAARGAALAERRQIPVAQARADATRAEQARAEVAELAITAAHAEIAILEAQMATLALQRERAEMRASVASLLMAQDARVFMIGDAPLPPMFSLIHGGVGSMRVDVFEHDLLRLVSGQAVALSGDSAALPIVLRAQLGGERTTTPKPASPVYGMFLEVELLTTDGDVLAVPAPSARRRHS